jgi:hypothetical protein
MKLWGLLLLALAPACSSSKAPAPREEPPTATEPAPRPEVGVLFERVYDGSGRAMPVFGPDGGITVGGRQWDRNGHYVGRNAWAIGGQAYPLAIIGEPLHPLVLVAGWGGMADMPERPAGSTGDGMWLLAAAPGADKPAHATWTAHAFLDDGVTLSPNGAAVAVIEGAEIVVRAVPTGTVITRAAFGKNDGAPRACWIDDARIAWLTADGDARRLHALGIRDHATQAFKLATRVSFAACDPAGAVAGVTLEHGAVGVLDLVTGEVLATVVPDADDVEVAVGERGAKLAVGAAEALVVYERDGAQLKPVFTAPRHDDLAPKLAFSPDGQRLAASGSTLLVLGPKTEARVRPPAPELRFELPEGFTAVPADAMSELAWRYAQLPAPTGAASLPAMLVHAQTEQDDAPYFTHVVALALDREELAPLPAPDAPDAELATFGKRAMAQLFGHWNTAELDERDRDATYTLRVGRTDSKPWFEARELWRDGCEPYDGYTRVVIDRDVVFVIRALTVPHGPIQGWLATFFDLPFGARVQTALRRGPSMGPC